MRTSVAPRLGHLAIAVHEPRRVTAFYRDLLGLQVVRHAANPLSGDHVHEDHELVLLTNPAAEHIAFRVQTAHQLRTLHTRAKQRGMELPYALNTWLASGSSCATPRRTRSRSTWRGAGPGPIGRS